MFSNPLNHFRISQKQNNSTQWKLVEAMMENRYNVLRDGVNTMIRFVFSLNINCSLCAKSPVASKSTSHLFACLLKVMR